MTRLLALCLALLAGPLTAGPQMLPDAEQPAWNAIGRVNVAGHDRRSMCTGTLVAPALVLTAAHCLLRPGGRPARPDNIHFVAGWRAGGYAAHGRAAEVHIDPGFLPGDAPGPAEIAADAAIVVLREPIASAAVKPLRLAPLPDPAPPLTVMGYRMDRAHALSRQGDCRVTHRTADRIGLDCTVVGGASGAPVLWQSPAGWRVVAVISASVPGNGRVRALAPLAHGRDALGIPPG